MSQESGSKPDLAACVVVDATIDPERAWFS